MTLASSGYISLGGTDPTRSANLAAGQAATATITMPSSVTRTLTGVSSGPLVLPNSYWGKPVSAFTPSLTALQAIGNLSAESYSVGAPCTAQIFFGSDGTWYFYGEALGDQSGNWGTPTTTGVGAGYWIQWTRTYFSGGAGATATTTSGWQQLSTSRYITVYNPGGLTFVGTMYNIQIATDSAGANVVASLTGLEIEAYGTIA